MRKLLNVAVMLAWVFAQTITAAHSHGRAHSHGHMPPVHGTGHIMAMQHGFNVLEQGHGEHAGHHAVVQRHMAAMPAGHECGMPAGHQCSMHSQQHTGVAADAASGDGAAKPCCTDMHCQSADLIKASVCSVSANTGSIYHLVAPRQDGRSPSFVLPPPNTLI